MVELSRDGKRVYFTNSLYGAWDEQFYPEGSRVDGEGGIAPDGGMTLDPQLLPGVRGDTRPHQVRLEGGDASSDSYCYPS